MNEHSVVRIESPAFAPGSVQLIEVAGRETLSQLFEFHAQVVSTDPAGLDVEALIGAPAVLVFERGDVEVRRMGGLIAGIRDSMHEETGRMVYDLWFAPRAFRMGLVETYEIFMDISVPDIVKKKLERAGLVEDTDFEFRLTASYPPREFVVQYKETDLAFVSRLLEHLGICFFFEHKDGADVLVLSDKNSGFAPVTGGKEVPFRSRGERLGVFSLESQTRMTPARYVVKDYNYRTPQVAMQASAPAERGDGGYVLEYGAHFKSPDEGAQIAKIRAEEIAAGRTVLEGKSDRHAFSAGAMFLLEEHPRGDMELLFTEVSHRAANSVLGTGKEGVRDYENSFKAIPYKTPFRPPRVTPKPRIHGVITGVIDAAAKGPYAELDPDGRYRVRFLFDAGSASDGQASRLCRMAQPHGGGGYGMHFPLRSGVEVILTFVEGDPDRPIILGVVPNPQTPSPVTAGNGTRNVIRTGGGNEINIDDTGGSERIKMTTPFGNSVIQMGARNLNEEGICFSTDEHLTSKAEKSVNIATPVVNAAGDIFSFLSAKDMTYFCTPWVNFLTVAKAALSGITNAAGALKSSLEAQKNDWAKARAAHVEELEKKATELGVSAGHKRTKAQQLRAQAADSGTPTEEEKDLANEQGAALPGPTKEALTAEAEKLEAEADEEERKAGALESMAAQTKVDAAKAEDEFKESTEGKVAELISSTEAWTSGASTLLSSASSLTGYIAQNLAADMANVAGVARANSNAVGGETVFLTPLVDSPHFTGGGANSAALVAGNNTLVSAGNSATIISMMSLLCGSQQAAVKSQGIAELYGQFDAYVEGQQKVRLKTGGTIEILAKPGAGGALPGKITATATDAFNLEVESGPAGVLAKNDITLRSKEGPVGITAEKGNIDIAAETGDLTVKARGEKCKLVLKDADVTLERDGWGLRVRDKRIGLGPVAELLPPLSIDTKMVRVAHDKSRLTLGETPLGVGATLAQGGCAVQVQDSGVTVVGKKLHLL